MKNPSRSMLQCYALVHHRHLRRTTPGKVTDTTMHHLDISMGHKTQRRPRSPPTLPRPVQNIPRTAKRNDNRTTPQPTTVHATQRHHSTPQGNKHQSRLAHRGRIPLRDTAQNNPIPHGSPIWPIRRSPTVTQGRETKRTWTQHSPCRLTHRHRTRYRNLYLRPRLLPSKTSSQQPSRKHNELIAKNIKRNFHK